MSTIFNLVSKSKDGRMAMIVAKHGKKSETYHIRRKGFLYYQDTFGNNYELSPTGMVVPCYDTRT